jgi:hypothetical protein
MHVNTFTHINLRQMNALAAVLPPFCRIVCKSYSQEFLLCGMGSDLVSTTFPNYEFQLDKEIFPSFIKFSSRSLHSLIIRSFSNKGNFVQAVISAVVRKHPTQYSRWVSNLQIPLQGLIRVSTYLGE